MGLLDFLGGNSSSSSTSSSDQQQGLSGTGSNYHAQTTSGNISIGSQPVALAAINAVSQENSKVFDAITKTQNTAAAAVAASQAQAATVTTPPTDTFIKLVAVLGIAAVAIMYMKHGR